jgi:hypothetical protein
MRVGWWDHPAGRAWNITARLVPPRMNTAGSENSGIVASGVDGRIVGDGWSVKLARGQDSPATMCAEEDCEIANDMVSYLM